MPNTTTGSPLWLLTLFRGATNQSVRSFPVTSLAFPKPWPCDQALSHQINPTSIRLSHLPPSTVMLFFIFNVVAITQPSWARLATFADSEGPPSSVSAASFGRASDSWFESSPSFSNTKYAAPEPLNGVFGAWPTYNTIGFWRTVVGFSPLLHPHLFSRFPDGLAHFLGWTRLEVPSVTMSGISGGAEESGQAPLSPYPLPCRDLD